MDTGSWDVVCRDLYTGLYTVLYYSTIKILYLYSLHNYSNTYSKLGCLTVILAMPYQFFIQIPCSHKQLPGDLDVHNVVQVFNAFARIADAMCCLKGDATLISVSYSELMWIIIFLRGKWDVREIRFNHTTHSWQRNMWNLVLRFLKWYGCVRNEYHIPSHSLPSFPHHFIIALSN